MVTWGIQVTFFFCIASHKRVVSVPLMQNNMTPLKDTPQIFPGMQVENDRTCISI